jgi:hypothetical protein
MAVSPIVFRPLIQQPELRRIIAIRAEIAYRNQMLVGLEESVLMRLVRGADVEPGVHQVWLQELIRGRTRKQILEVR